MLGQNGVTAPVLETEPTLHTFNLTASIKKRTLTKWDDWQGDTPLHLAIRYGDLNKAYQLIEEEADLYAKNNRGITPVHLAARLGNIELLAAMDNKIKSSHGWLSRMFFNWKLDVAIADNEGETPIHVAARNPYSDVLQWMLKTDKYDFQDINESTEIHFIPLCDNKGRTPLHYAASANNVEGIKILLDDYRLDRSDKKGNLPLHFAAKTSSVDALRYILEVNEAEKNKINEISWDLIPKSKNIFDINARNEAGFTAYMIASELKDKKAVALLKEAKCDEASLVEVIAKAILEPNQEKGPRNEQESLVASLVEKSPKVIKANLNSLNFIHLCALSFNYRLALILLHPLSISDRRALCGSKNREGKTPLTMLQDAYENYKSENKEELNVIYEKLKRLILKYDNEGYQNHVRNGLDVIKYNILSTQDKRDELMSSRGYNYAADIMLYGTPAYAFTINTMATGQWLIGLEAALSAHFGVDVYNASDRILGHIKQIIPAPLQAPITAVQYFLNGMGWYRNTVMRLSAEGIRQVGAFALTQFDPADYSFASNNYFTHINTLGALYFTSEELAGRRLLAPYLQEYVPSIEQYLVNNHNFYSVDEITNIAFQKINDKLEVLTGINVKNIIANKYQIFRDYMLDVKPLREQLVEGFEEHILPEIKGMIVETDPATYQIIIKGAEAIFIKYYDADKEVLQSKLLDWINLSNNGLSGNINYELLNYVGNELASDDASYGEIIASIIMQPHLVKNYEFSQVVLSQKQNDLAKNLDVAKTDDAVTMIESLASFVSFNKDEMDAIYLQTRKSGQVASNEYQNQLKASFHNSKAIENATNYRGRAEHMAWTFIRDNPLIFGNMDAGELTASADFLIKILINSQVDDKSKHERQAVACYEKLRVFFTCMVLNPLYMEGKILSDSSRVILSQFDPVLERAAFAVHQVQIFLKDSEGYRELTLSEQYDYYYAFIDAHYVGGLSRSETMIHDLAWQAFQSHAIDKDNLQLVCGKYELDEAASHIFDMSRDTAEFRWSNSAEYETRVVPVQIDSAWKQTIDFIDANSSFSVGVGASTDGSTPRIGPYDASKGQLSPFNFPLRIPQIGNYNFTLPEKINMGSSSGYYD